MNLDALTESIKNHEGLRLKPYTDTVGKLTIGYGRNLSDMGISNEEASYLLGNDIQSAIREAEAQPWWECVADNDARSRAMVEILFNMGLSRLNGFTHALGYLLQRDYQNAAAAFRQSKWFGQVGNRAVVLTKMIETGES